MKKQFLQTLSLVIFSCFYPFCSFGGSVLFEDDFERSESQEIAEEIGNGWSSNTDKYAPGHKQVDLKDGAMHVNRLGISSHNVNLAQSAGFKNGSFEMRFMFSNSQDAFNLSFRDPSFKETKQGSLFVVTVDFDGVSIKDVTTSPKLSKSEKAGSLNDLPEKVQDQLAKSQRIVSRQMAAGI